MEFDQLGARRFGELTSENLGHKLAIIIDGRVTSAPVIQAPIRQGRSTITVGEGTAREKERRAAELAALLRAGSLPAPLVEKSSSKLGPSE